MGVDSRAASAAKIWRLACASTLTVRSFDFDTRIVMYNLSARFMLVRVRQLFADVACLNHTRIAVLPQLKTSQKPNGDP